VVGLDEVHETGVDGGGLVGEDCGGEGGGFGEG
jgi:hypothetical protein